MYRELQGCMSIYYVHACMILICLGTSYQVHSYLFSFFMRESFSSCILVSLAASAAERVVQAYGQLNSAQTTCPHCKILQSNQIAFSFILDSISPRGTGTYC